MPPHFQASSKTDNMPLLDIFATCLLMAFRAFARAHSSDAMMMAKTDATAKLSPPWQSCFRPNLFEGKVALVSGGGTGLGRAISFEIATLGATVVIASRNREVCLQAAKEMNALLQQTSGKVVVGPSTSIRKEQDIQNLVRVKRVLYYVVVM